MDVKALINSSSEINTMTSAYASKLGLQARHMNVGVQKIDGSTLPMFKMVLASFQVKNKLWKIWFFQETFLLPNTSVQIVLGLLFWLLVIQTSNL